MPVVCQCEVDQIESEKIEAEQRLKQRKIQEIFKHSRLGPKLMRATFQNFEKLPGTKVAFQEALKFVIEKRWESHEGLLISGRAGNGKSHLAAAIINEIIPLGVAGLMLIVPDLMTQIKATYGGRKAHSEYDLLYWVSEADVVVLDDLGAENLTDNTQEVIYKIVNSLYNMEKSLIVTTNFDVERELPQRVGLRIYDRLLEMCRIVENNGASFRRILAEQKLKEGN